MTRVSAWSLNRTLEWARRLGASPPKRMTASWSGSRLGSHRIQGCGAIFARYGGLPSDRCEQPGCAVQPPPRNTWRPARHRRMAIPFRYVTENRTCQQVANPSASTPSATPNDKLGIALAGRPNNRHPKSVTVGRRTDGPELSVGTTPSPSWSRCKPSTPPGMTRCPTACAIEHFHGDWK